MELLHFEEPKAKTEIRIAAAFGLSFNVSLPSNIVDEVVKACCSVYNEYTFFNAIS